MPRSACTARPSTGGSGSPWATSPTTAGAATCSAAPSPSRASPTPRPGPCWPRPTTSLPETPQGERNWDYRYAWVRDSTFALWGLYTLGFDREANDFFYFIADACRDGQPLQVMYGVGGERELTEESLPHLSGYEGAWPVRTGNAAYKQQQHDVWGAVLDSVLLHARSRAQLQESFWPILKRQVECAAEHWEEPDRGIWEVRGEPQHFTSSKFMCWVALDRGARLARMYDEPMYAEKWQALADQIHADICKNGVDERGVFVQRYGSDALDASLLLLPLLRFLPPEDPRIRATVLAIADELTHEGLVLRYRVEETDDGLTRRRGHLHHLLLLAGVGPDRDRRDRAGPAAVRAPAVLRQPARAVRRGARSPHRPPPGQLSPGVHPPGPGQRRGARHPGRGGATWCRSPCTASATEPIADTVADGAAGATDRDGHPGFDDPLPEDARGLEPGRLRA